MIERTGLSVTFFYKRVELEIANQTISHAYQELEAAHEMIQKQALTDGLTELPNHRAIMNQLRKELSHARRYHRPFSILFFDTDRFKSVNDTYGHTVGDEVLRQIGRRAVGILRTGDMLGRFSGEEFVALLPETHIDEARIVAEHIRATIATEPIMATEINGDLSITVSIGIASYPIDGDTEEVLLQEADAAMYMAKHSGRNQVRIAEEIREQRRPQALPAA